MAIRPQSEAVITLLTDACFRAIARGDAEDVHYLIGAMAQLACRVADVCKLSIAERDPASGRDA
jgi:hypothetical protein